MGQTDTWCCFDFFIDTYDKNNTCNLHLKHPEKYPAPTQRSSSSSNHQAAITRSCFVLALIETPLNGEVFLSSPSANFSVSVQRFIAITAKSCLCNRRFYNGALRGQENQNLRSSMALELLCLCYLITSFRGSSDSSVPLQSQITQSKRSRLHLLITLLHESSEHDVC